jgi:hypothetical protein
MLQRQAFASRNMSEEIKTVSEPLIRAINSVKNSPLRGRIFGKLCDDTKAEHTAFLCYFQTGWISCDKMLHRVYELKEGIAIFFFKCQY